MVVWVYPRGQCGGRCILGGSVVVWVYPRGQCGGRCILGGSVVVWVYTRGQCGGRCILGGSVVVWVYPRGQCGGGCILGGSLVVWVYPRGAVYCTRTLEFNRYTFPIWLWNPPGSCHTSQHSTGMYQQTCQHGSSGRGCTQLLSR